MYITVILSGFYTFSISIPFLKSFLKFTCVCIKYSYFMLLCRFLCCYGTAIISYGPLCCIANMQNLTMQVEHFPVMYS